MGATGGGGVCEMGVVGRGGGGGVDVRAGGGRKGNMAGWLVGWLVGIAVLPGKYYSHPLQYVEILAHTTE